MSIVPQFVRSATVHVRPAASRAVGRRTFPGLGAGVAALRHPAGSVSAGADVAVVGGAAATEPALDAAPPSLDPHAATASAQAPMRATSGRGTGPRIMA